MLARLVVATHNRKKAGEMLTLLGELLPGTELTTLADYEGAPEPEETGSTYAENAAIKARSAALFTGEWCLADDAGLEIDALDGAPGLYSKRFGGEDLPFPDKMARILSMLAECRGADRAARFRCHVALASPGAEKVWDFSATCEGQIAEGGSGGGGFGYDPVFYLPEYGCTMADLTASQKHRISHRGKVLRAVSVFIERYTGV